jgi:transcription-repair coupling factor (superfamily II helicase)
MELKIHDVLEKYRGDGFVRSVAEACKDKQKTNIQLKGLKGSLDAVIAAAIHGILGHSQLYVLHDKEEAAYFFNDLQSLLGSKTVHFFPTSYKRPYQFEETENANILQRAEVLNKINHKSAAGELIVTYPEALTERVIDRRTLLEHTFFVEKGQKIDDEALEATLLSYGFEPTDTVYEAGFFARRGGIIDIYSYANELPYRIELFGDEVESIRTFDPESQLSSDNLKSISIIPDIQTRLLEEKRQSFLRYLPGHTIIWIKDVILTQDTIQHGFDKASDAFHKILRETSHTHSVKEPADLFESAGSFVEELANFRVIEFGNRFTKSSCRRFEYNAGQQPSFNKNFELIADSLKSNQQKGYQNFLVADSFQQLQKLDAIFEEIAPELEYRTLNISLRSGFVDHELRIACFTDHQLFERFHRYRLREKRTRSRALTKKALQSLQPGDFVTHIDYGIGRFAGLDKVEINGHTQEALRIVYKDDDLLYVGVQALHKISKYSGKDGIIPAMNKLGSQEWENKKKRIKKKVRDIAKDLIQLYAKRKAAPGFAFSKDNYLQAELESSFIYEDTPDQAQATEDVKSDLENPHPMDRLVCGDVGFGKTEVAIRAAFKAVCDGKQVAVLVPTTILAMQHYRTFKERLADFSLELAYLNRFTSASQTREILEKTQKGKIDVLIGTHRIVNKDVQFKDLGLLVIDEEQKFGVKVKEKLKKMRVHVDVLTLTATPIPRTLHFSLMGARDLSIISTPPPNRQPVTTEIHTFNEATIRDAISFELRRGGQVFFVHNRISDIEGTASTVLRLVPDARVGVAHGQMEGKQLEKVMIRFIEGEYDVLVSTNIIESGLDIPNANTIIINQAHMFGLSDLHQMRGRVGRSNKKAFCYLLAPPSVGLTAEARKRLITLEEFSELGDGFKVAMRDLDIRGAGNLLGAEQSGFINDLGFDAYHKILDEAVQDLKEHEFRELFTSIGLPDLEQQVADCTIETDFEVLIPEEYVSNISERLQLYDELDNIASEEKLQHFVHAMRDRFGPLPPAVEGLVKIVRLRWNAEKMGIEKLLLKNNAMKAHFMPSENTSFYNSEAFGKVLNYVQSNPQRCKLREVKNRVLLLVQDVPSIEEASTLLDIMTKKTTVNAQ